MQLSTQEFIRCIAKIQDYISSYFEDRDLLSDAMEVLNIFYKANIKRDLKDQVSTRLFYNEEVNKIDNIQDDYDKWLE